MIGLLQGLKRHLRRRGESGQSVIILAIGFVALVGFVGITTDISLAFVRYAQLSRAVDAASIAAANQMREDRSLASVGMAARQFIEFHGLNPEQVWVDTCLSTDFSDPELCTDDQAKLVRVRAFIKEPTVFMRLLGIPNFDLVVSAVSQTAALDVVIILDVSESMLQDTNYLDWATTEEIGINPESRVYRNWGVVYRPPRADEILGRFVPANEVASKTAAFWEAWRSTSHGGTDPGDGLLNFPQISVNRRLTYYDARTGSAIHPAANDAVPDSDRKAEYKVMSDNQFFTNTTLFPDYNAVTDTGVWPAGLNRTATHPRENCRVRFYPPSVNLNLKSRYSGYTDASGVPVDLVTMYTQEATTTGNAAFAWPTSSSFADGFVPNFRFYDCCNDPNGNGRFEDLNCQPFKQTRDAVFQFIDRIDFLRGDRAAIVTFNRSAFLINPFGYASPAAQAAEDESQRPGAMLDSWEGAFYTIRDLVGVHAEPNFYVYQTGTTTDLSSGWGPPGPNRLAVGVDAVGDSIPVDYESTAGYGANGGITATGAALKSLGHITNYPAWENCSVNMATLNSERTPFDDGLVNISLPNGLPTPPGYSKLGRDPAWETFKSGSAALIQTASQQGKPAGQRYSYNLFMSYERWAACRNGNVGAALREGNNALLNPFTIRRFGTIWIMVLLSDGAAGASDPVRQNGYKLKTADPYQYNAGPPATWGQPGEYGAYGLCPMGTPNQPGELTAISDDHTSGVIARYPYCSDEQPETRYTCDFRPLRTIATHPAYNTNALHDRDYDTAETEAWNRDQGNLFDVDIDPDSSDGYGGCSNLYDVDDYAHDWADYISLDDLANSGNAQLPTIFTIGFGMEFTVKQRPDGTALVFDTAKPVNDPVNLASAQSNVDALCAVNLSNCLGEQLLRYIADVGDNNNLDNDYYQDAMEAWYAWGMNPGQGLAVDGKLEDGRFNQRDRCQTQDDLPNALGTYDNDSNGIMDTGEIAAEYGHLQPNTSCGNYYYAPNGDELQFVFDDIASRMFTRLSR